MQINRRTLLAVASTAIGTTAAGCTGGDSADGATTTPTSDPTTAQQTTDATTATPTPTTTVDGDTALRVRQDTAHGDILVGPDGRSLYMFDNDTQGSGASSCTGGCASSWPPLTGGSPVGEAGVTAELTTFERGDGSTQIAANGWPLYYFASDAAPGDTNGQGVGGVWWLLTPEGVPIRPDSTATTTTEQTTTAEPARIETRVHAEHGEILVGPSGNTVYMLDGDPRGGNESTCRGSCTDSWPPVIVENGVVAGDGVTAPVDSFVREDGGGQQATANGWPLYYFTPDDSPSDAMGQGVGGVWWVLRADGTPRRDQGTTTTDDGDMGGY